MSHKNTTTTNITSNQTLKHLDSNLKSLELKMKLSPSLLALTSSAFCATTVSALDSQKLLRGAIVLASDSKYNNIIPADTTVSENLVSIPNDDDPAYIHKKCSFPNYPGYCGDVNQCSTGIGWYCNDGQPVHTNDPSEFDTSYISKGCHVGVQYSNEFNGWFCRDEYMYPIDRAFIKRGCDPKDVHYMTNADCKNKWNTKCAHIEDLPDNVGAWYCGNENVYGIDPSAFETAIITKGCHNGVKWDDKLKAWDCNW